MVTVSARGFGSNAARHGGCKPKVPPLTTLHPPLLQPSDFRSLSSLLKPKIGQQMQERTNISPVHYKYHDGRYIPFPNDAHGFFYFHPGPSYAPIAGEVRFRIVHSGDPAHFNRGHDLLDTSQRLPWSIPLATVLYYKTYKAFAHLLIDATIPGLHATGVLERFARNDLQNAGMDASIMHSLGQPLFSGVSRPFIHFRIARSDGLSKLHTFRVLPTRKTQSHLSSFTPYTGTSRIVCYVPIRYLCQLLSHRIDTLYA
jgi:hypothetical protein